MLNFESLSKKPRHFLNFTGLTVEEFMIMQKTIEDDWQSLRSSKYKKKRIRKIGGGRKLKLSKLEDRLLVFLIYAKIYTSQVFLEYLFGIDESNICRIIQEFTPLLSQRITINQRTGKGGKRINSMEDLRELFPDLDEVLIDATEQKINRPKKKRERKKYHSGKKKAFTVKTQILTDRKGIIIHASDSSPGRIHDYNYFQRTTVPQWLKNNSDITVYGDLGYQGVNKDYPEISFVLPKKRNRWKKN